MPEIPRVIAIPGEWWTFNVHSWSKPGTRHRVELDAFGWNGSCTCEWYEYNCAPELSRGAAPCDGYRCRHIHVARSYVLDEILPKLAKAMRGERVPESNAELRPLAKARASIMGLTEMRELSAISELIEERMQQVLVDPPAAVPKVYHLRDNN